MRGALSSPHVANLQRVSYSISLIISHAAPEKPGMIHEIRDPDNSSSLSIDAGGDMAELDYLPPATIPHNSNAAIGSKGTALLRKWPKRFCRSWKLSSLK